MNKQEKMKALVQELNKASKEYYSFGREIMSDHEFDEKYMQLELLEKELGMVLSNSPTVNVGYEVLSSLPKEAHESQMLSLNKTKNPEELKSWLGEEKGLLSWKMDGLTIVLTYEGGKLQKAITRGNGEVGEVITNNARTFVNLPGTIPYKEKLVLRGEAVISYSRFQEINQSIESVEEQYKNPRNLCSGTVRQLNNQITAERGVEIYIFSVVSAKKPLSEKSREEELIRLNEFGFQTVAYRIVNSNNILDVISFFEEEVKTYNLPSDGLVLTYDDFLYGKSLGKTSKFPRDAIAFKWADELAITKLQYIEWSPSRTGLINPVAVFDTVDLEGTSVSRASVHNLSVMEDLKLGIGDQIKVYKANMIIPQISENITKSGNMEIPKICPACGGNTEIQVLNEAKVLYCVNPNCPAKKNKRFALFVSRNALNIDGLSEATLEKLIAKGFLHTLSDIFNLEIHRLEISEMEGFGEKSAENLLKAVEQAKHTTMAKMLYGLGIANIGVANAKLIANYFRLDINQMKNATIEELVSIDTIGTVIAEAFVSYFSDKENLEEFDQLCEILTFESLISNKEQILKNKVIVITGSLDTYKDRSAMKEVIESLGGKVTASVSKKTDFLINNDVTSTSSKNKKAKELGVEIIREQDFIDRFISE